MRGPTSAVVAAGLVATGLVFGSPTAQADGTTYVGPSSLDIFISDNCGFGATTVSDAWAGGFCDNPAVPTGQHFHCEWQGGFSTFRSCDWRWADNTLAPPPA